MGNNSKPRTSVGIKISTATKVHKVGKLIDQIIHGVRQINDPDLADQITKSVDRLCKLLRYDRRGWIKVQGFKAFRLTMPGYHPLIISADTRYQAQFQAALWLNGGDTTKPIKFHKNNPACQATIRRAHEYDDDAMIKDRPCVLYMETPAQEENT